MADLPISVLLGDIKNTLLIKSNIVITAPPGSGKTTQVPLSLLNEPWLAGKKILLLQPRRLATKLVAGYMASLLGEKAGETVGYRIRLESKVSAATRVELITEGILIRMLQNDQSLSDVGLVIFDEFHERSLFADLGLAFCLQCQAVLREDLRIIVMSATLDAGEVAEKMGNAPILAAEGRTFPVETHYQEKRVEGPVEAVVAKAVEASVMNDDGDILVFLPGAQEIRRTQNILAGTQTSGLRSNAADGPLSPACGNIKILPLYGSLPPAAQEQAVTPAKKGERKIVLATSIAETSLTVEGIAVVIDSGLMRVPRFSPTTSLTNLETIRVTRAAADQRRGRAGRLRPGKCYRLWTKEQDQYLNSYSKPEILESDLAPLALELALWGAHDPAELKFIDQPPAVALGRARSLLFQLGAVDDTGKITAQGKSMGEAGLHPRLARMIIKAREAGCGGLACDLAALLGQRDFFRSDGSKLSSDLRLRLEVLHSGSNNSPDFGAIKKIKAESAYLKRAFNIPSEPYRLDDCGLALSFAYPDRVGQRRGDGRYLLRGGRGAILPPGDDFYPHGYLVIAAMDDRGADGRVILAAPLSENDLFSTLADQLSEEEKIIWDNAGGAVRTRKLLKLGEITLKETPLAKPGADAALAVLLGAIRQSGLSFLPWTSQTLHLRQRMAFMHRLGGGWPDVSDESLLSGLEEWLAPHIYGVTSLEELRQVNITAALEAMLSWEQRRQLDEYAPSHIHVPSGRRIAVDYSDTDAPVLAVRLQEMFGQKSTPKIAGGKVALTLHLLSPAQRPVQVTKDLASFWSGAYYEVKKDLMGRYPKHYWPDDPLNAEATRHTRPRK